jgi:hypothetical protein
LLLVVVAAVVWYLLTFIFFWPIFDIMINISI